jgi:hypothetical protein
VVAAVVADPPDTSLMSSLLKVHVAEIGNFRQRFAECGYGCRAGPEIYIRRECYGGCEIQASLPDEQRCRVSRSYSTAWTRRSGRTGRSGISGCAGRSNARGTGGSD